MLGALTGHTTIPKNYTTGCQARKCDGANRKNLDFEIHMVVELSDHNFGPTSLRGAQHESSVLRSTDHPGRRSVHGLFGNIAACSNHDRPHPGHGNRPDGGRGYGRYGHDHRRAARNFENRDERPVRSLCGVEPGAGPLRGEDRIEGIQGGSARECADRSRKRRCDRRRAAARQCFGCDHGVGRGADDQHDLGHSGRNAEQQGNQ